MLKSLLWKWRCCKMKKDSKPSLSESIPEKVLKHPAWGRLIDQLAWYDSKSKNAQKWYKVLKYIQITLAAIIPLMVLADLPLTKWLTALAGASIALLEAVQQLNQFSVLWVTYRSTAEHLKHEKYLFLSSAGPYRDITDDERLVQLAERVEEHVSTEHANWFNENKRLISPKKHEGN